MAQLPLPQKRWTAATFGERMDIGECRPSEQRRVVMEASDNLGAGMEIKLFSRHRHRCTKSNNT